MPTFTEVTLQESYNIITSCLQKNTFIEISTGFTHSQLTNFIEQFYLQSNLSSTIERSLSKSLCCFLYELQQERASHYSDIRSIVLQKYEHMVNDYSSLQYWRLIKKSTEGAGFWEITDRGVAFLEGRLQLAERVTIKNKRVVSASAERVSISDFYGLEFLSYNPELPVTLIPLTIEI